MLLSLVTKPAARWVARNGASSCCPTTTATASSWAAFSSSGGADLVDLTTNSASGVAVLTMQNAPVNSLSLEMCNALINAVKETEQDPRMQALILKSNNPKVFSAGLDLLELYNADFARLNEFWTSFQNLYITLYGTRLACIAAIEGHAPAAGCGLALSCDYRIMAAASVDPKSTSSSTTTTGAATIGLNESKFGLVAPPWLAQQLVDTVGRRRAELSLALGTLYSAEEALAIGLVDELVAKDDLQRKAELEAAKWTAVVHQARVASKQLLREERIEALRSKQKDDRDYFVRFITQENVQKSLGAYLQRLTENRKRK